MFLKKCFFVFALFASVFLFSGCENFLEGGNLAKELEKAVDYENKSYARLSVSADPEKTAQIVPAAGDYNSSYKAGDSINLKFESKKQYKFIKWKADPQDSVIFSPADDEETVAKIIKSDNKIVISPVVYLIPAVEDFSPKHEQAGFPQDTYIVIKFNKPVDPSDFTDDLVMFKNISILDRSTDLLSGDICYFKKPVFEDGNRTMIIQPDNEFPILVPGSSEFKDITVSLKLAGSKDAAEGEHLYFENDENFTYRINSSFDVQEPELLSSEFFTDAECTEVLSEGQSANRLFVRVSGKDNVGVTSIKIYETLNGNIMNKTFPLENRKEVEDVVQKFDFLHFEDGAVELKVVLADGAGNESNERIFQLKKVCSFGPELSLKTDTCVPENQSSNIIPVSEAEKYFDMDKFSFYLKTSDFAVSGKGYSWNYSYSQVQDVFPEKRIPLPGFGPENLITVEDSSLDIYKPLYLKVYGSDPIGNNCEKSFVLMPKVKINSLHLVKASGSYSEDWDDEGSSVNLVYDIEPFEHSENYRLGMAYITNLFNSTSDYSIPGTYVGLSSVCSCINAGSYSRYNKTTGETDYFSDCRVFFFWYDIGQSNLKSIRNCAGPLSSLNELSLVRFENEVIPSPVLTDENISIESCGENSGMTRIKVTIPSKQFEKDGKQYEYDYLYIKGDTTARSFDAANNDHRKIVKLTKNSDDEWEGELLVSTEFLLHNDIDHKSAKPFFVDEDGNYKFFAGGVKGSSRGETFYCVEKENVEDNISPSLVNSAVASEIENGKRIRLWSVTDYNSGLKSVLCYVSPMKNSWVIKGASLTYKNGSKNFNNIWWNHLNCFNLAEGLFDTGYLTEDEVLNDFKMVQAQYDENKKYWYMPVTSDIENGSYVIVQYAEDNAGNYVVKPVRYYHKDRLDVPFEDKIFKVDSSKTYSIFKYSKSGSSTVFDEKQSNVFYGIGKDVKYVSTYPDSSKNSYTVPENSYKYTVERFDSSGNWVMVVDSETGYSDQKTAVKKSVMPEILFSSKPEVKDSFIKICVEKADYYDETTNYQFGRKYFASPSYYYTGFDTSKGELSETKEVLETGSGVVVYPSDPVLIYTVTSPVDFGKDAELWDYRCGEEEVLKVREFNPGEFNNYPYSAASVPAGNYRRVIVHFADGTSYVSDLK